MKTNGMEVNKQTNYTENQENEGLVLGEKQPDWQTLSQVKRENSN